MRWLLLFVVFLVPVLRAQETGIVINGPYGVPRLVLDEGQKWSTPIKVYEDAQMSMYVPDLTTPNWLSWHKSQFQANGVYFTLLYVHSRKTRLTSRMLMTVDTRNDTIAMKMMTQQSAPGPISTLPPPFLAAVRKTTALVQREFARAKTQPSVEDWATEQRQTTLWLFMCGAEAKSPDCALGPEEFAKRNPVHRPELPIVPSMPNH